MAQSQALACLKLSAINRLDAGADDFRNIGSRVDAEAGDGRIQLHVARGEDEVGDNENLQVDRCRTNHGHIQSAEAVEQTEQRIFVFLRNILDHRYQNPDEHTEQNGKQRNDEGVLHTLQICQIAVVGKKCAVKPLAQLENPVQDDTVPFPSGCCFAGHNTAADVLIRLLLAEFVQISLCLRALR